MPKNNVTRGYGLLESLLAKKRAKIANRYIPEKLRDGRILDIGCGTTPLFLINTRFREKYGIDPSVEISNLKYDIKLSRWDIEKNTNLPFKDDFFDIITMLAVFEHIEPRKLIDILKEIRRILKPGGRVILSTPCPWTNKLLTIMSKLYLVSPKEIKEHKGLYDKSSIASYFYRTGFERNKMNFGYFELFLNNWAYVDK